jgi:predicted MFS family arabinose efflux permease
MPPTINDTRILNADVSASRTPLYLTFALMLFGFGSISSARVALSLYALDLGASASAVGILVGSLYVFPLLISWPVGRYSDRVVSFMFGLGMGCGQPITTMLIFSRSAEGRSGETLGLRQSVNNAIRVSAPAVFGFVATAFGLAPVFWISAIMMGGGGILSRPRRNG